jgi:hypothetical protein
VGLALARLRLSTGRRQRAAHEDRRPRVGAVNLVFFGTRDLIAGVMLGRTLREPRGGARERQAAWTS